ncbi:MAG: hypothetical protein ACUVTL_08990 [Thermoproteota archaeon]
MTCFRDEYPKGSEDAFYTVYGSLKWFLKALDLEKYLKGFEELLKYVEGTELWPFTVSILALVIMEFTVVEIFYGTTTRILG